jgi:hypothetical protein
MDLIRWDVYGANDSFMGRVWAEDEAAALTKARQQMGARVARVEVCNDQGGGDGGKAGT